MKRWCFASLKMATKKGAPDRGAVGLRKGKTTEQSQEVAVAQQDTILGSESKPNKATEVGRRKKRHRIIPETCRIRRAIPVWLPARVVERRR